MSDKILIKAPEVVETAGYINYEVIEQNGQKYLVFNKPDEAQIRAMVKIQGHKSTSRGLRIPTETAFWEHQEAVAKLLEERKKQQAEEVVIMQR